MLDLTRHEVIYATDVQCERFGIGYISTDPACELCQYKTPKLWHECRWRQLGLIDERSPDHHKGQTHKFIPIDWENPITLDDLSSWVEAFREGTLARRAIEHFIGAGLLTTMDDMNREFVNLPSREMAYGYRKRGDYLYTIANYSYDWSKPFRFSLPFTTRRYRRLLGLYKAQV